MNVGREQEVLVIAAVWGIALMYTERDCVFTIRRTLKRTISYSHHTHTKAPHTITFLLEGTSGI